MGYMWVSIQAVKTTLSSRSIITDLLLTIAETDLLSSWEMWEVPYINIKWHKIVISQVCSVRIFEHEWRVNIHKLSFRGVDLSLHTNLD